MLAYNPFSDLGAFIPSFAMQAFLVAMVLLVIGGVVLDMMHKKNVKYFFENAQKAKKICNKRIIIRRKNCNNIKNCCIRYYDII